MSETRTLWQRCEALGQFVDYKDDHVEMCFSGQRWTIRHDGHPIIYIYQDRMQGSEWLASAILSRIEAHHEAKVIAERATVTAKNINEKLREALSDETRSFRRDLFLAMQRAENPQGWEIIRNGYNEPVFLRQVDGFVVMDLYPKDRNYELVCNAPIPVDVLQGLFRDQMVEIGDTIEVCKDDSMDERVGIAVAQRWTIGEQFVVMEIQEFPWGVFYADGEGHTLHPRRAKVVKKAYLQTPKTELPEVTYVVEAPKTNEPTQEQLKAVWEHVMNLTGEQAESFGFQYAVIGLTPSPRFELKIETLQSSLDPWLVTIVHTADGEFTFSSTYSFAGTCSRLGCFDIARGIVIESPNQFVSIPVTEWKQLREATSTIQAILFPEVKEVEFEN